MDELKDELGSIGKAVKGDPSLGQQGIIPRLDMLEKRLDAGDVLRAEREKRESYTAGKHALYSAAVAMLVSGIISMLAAFLAAKLAENPAPAYYVLSTGQAATAAQGTVPPDGTIKLTPQAGPLRH